MKESCVVAVFGLSGVGKSWLTSRYAKRFGVLHVQASQLLRETKASLFGVNLTAEELRQGAVLDNQELLVRAFTNVRRTSVKPIIFDGHCVVDNGTDLIEIPSEIIVGLHILHIVFVEGPVEAIVERRLKDSDRVRPIRSVFDLGLHQHRAKEVCRNYSTSLGIPLTFVLAGDEDAFADVLSLVLANKAS
jgi:adenylate kinase